MFSSKSRDKPAPTLNQCVLSRAGICTVLELIKPSPEASIHLIESYSARVVKWNAIPYSLTVKPVSLAHLVQALARR
jgi:hypothetical protein